MGARGSKPKPAKIRDLSGRSHHKKEPPPVTFGRGRERNSGREVRCLPLFPRKERGRGVAGREWL